jgi:diacylglycerol kinase family enzyme
MSRPDWEAVHKTPLGILPGGTGNALASSLLSRWKDGLTSSSLMLHSSLLLTKKKISPLDLMLLETDSGDKMCSFLSVCYGLISDVDIESEKYRGLGIIRNTVGSIIRIVNLKTYNCRFSYQSVSSTMNKSSTVLGINNVSHTEENDNSLSFSPSMPQGICYQTVEEESQSCTTLPDSSSLTSFRVDVGIEASEHCGTRCVNLKTKSKIENQICGVYT